MGKKIIAAIIILLIVVIGILFTATTRLKFSTVESKKSGIFGTVLLGPTCPVQRNPPEENCKDRPYQATIFVINIDGKQLSEFTSDTSGDFKVELPAGEYTLESNSQMRFPIFKSASVTVHENEFTNLTIYFDTGIR